MGKDLTSQTQNIINVHLKSVLKSYASLVFTDVVTGAKRNFTFTGFSAEGINMV